MPGIIHVAEGDAPNISSDGFPDELPLASRADKLVQIFAILVSSRGDHRAAGAAHVCYFVSRLDAFGLPRGGNRSVNLVLLIRMRRNDDANGENRAEKEPDDELCFHFYVFWLFIDVD